MKLDCKHFDSKGCFYCGEEHGYLRALDDVRRELKLVRDMPISRAMAHQEMLIRLEKLERKQRS